ncbi:AraC family transcriptional regulator [Chitinophaga parva]|uniref:AraC family transcriptional regulator n=1 Tax=Chitinophaga parva TaxID=2169414 RepID=A0A2T7BF14_9BACT|nr:AraC family transcriptional regulator [Chitinophaga parva]PUZ24813.1 AraC family transcriptional regulator [Chitinophaga parva]
MQKENLYQPYEIEVKTLEEGPAPGHVHSFFELVYVLEGTGIQCINNHEFSYFPNHMFLITPEDCHAFKVQTATRFFFMRFNDAYIASGSLKADRQRHRAFNQRLEFILQSANHQPGCILWKQDDKLLMRPLLEAMARELSNRELYSQEIIEQFVNTVLWIVVRNIARTLPQKVDAVSAEKTQDILQYIHTNIYEPEMLRAPVIAGHFGISVNYLGKYFKKHTAETLQQYITTYKLKLVEKRLLHSDMRINEIAMELNFADESHLNRIFKKYQGMSPTAYRKSRRRVAV